MMMINHNGNTNNNDNNNNNSNDNFITINKLGHNNTNINEQATLASNPRLTTTTTTTTTTSTTTTTTTNNTYPLLTTCRKPCVRSRFRETSWISDRTLPPQKWHVCESSTFGAAWQSKIMVRGCLWTKNNSSFPRASALQNSSRNSSPAPLLMFFKLIFPRVFLSGGVFLFTDTGSLLTKQNHTFNHTHQHHTNQINPKQNHTQQNHTTN